MTTSPKQRKKKIAVVHRGPSIFEVANYVHHTVERYCEYCGEPMSPSDVNDYGSLCERCYKREYYH